MSFLFFILGLLGDVPPVATECICTKAKVHDGWCDPCGFGFVAGLKIPSKLFFTTIDHGHEVPADAVRCETCRIALRDDGFCETCRLGYFRGKLYFSRFTKLLAQGQRLSFDDLTCPKCRQNFEHGGWCDECKRGLVGNTATTQREGFDDALASFRRLKQGLQYLEKCELCGIAIYANGMCPKHRLVYKDGKGIPE